LAGLAAGIQHCCMLQDELHKVILVIKLLVCRMTCACATIERCQFFEKGVERCVVIYKVPVRCFLM